MTPRILTPEEVVEIVALRKRRSLPTDLAESFDRLIHTLRQREAELVGYKLKLALEENARMREVVEVAAERVQLPDRDALARWFVARLGAEAVVGDEEAGALLAWLKGER